MPQTSPGDLFQVETVLDLVNGQLFDKVTLLNSGYIADARDTAILDSSSTKIQVPRSQTVAANQGVKPNTRTGAAAGTGDKIEITFDEYTVLDKMVNYDIDSKAAKILGRMRDPNQYMANEVMKKVRVHIQRALLGASETGGLPYKDPAGLANWNGMRKAVTKKWGENDDALPLAIFHPNCMYDIVSSEEAKKSGVFGVDGVVRSGKLYTFAGMNLMQLNAVSKNADGTYNNAIIMPDALQFYMDEDIQYGEARKPKTTTWECDWWFSYAAWLSQEVPIGAITYKVLATVDTEPEEE